MDNNNANTLHNYFNVNEIFERKLKEKLFDVISINSQPTDITVLPNGFLALWQFNSVFDISLHKYHIKIFDENFNLVKTIDKISNQQINNPSSIACNKENRIYIANRYPECIIMANLDFHLKTLNITYTPCGICCSNGYVFVCNYTENSINKYTDELHLIETKKLNFTPWKVEAINKTICVHSQNDRGLRFYNIDTFQLISQYDHGKCRIMVVNSLFYEFGLESKRVHCYDENGKLLRDLNLDFFNEFFQDGLDGSTALLKNSILIWSWSQSKILKISLNAETK